MHEARHAVVGAIAGFLVKSATIDTREAPEGALGYVRALSDGSLVSRLAYGIAGYMGDPPTGLAWPMTYTAARAGDVPVADAVEIAATLRRMHEGGLPDDALCDVYERTVAWVASVLEDEDVVKLVRLTAHCLVTFRTLNEHELALIFANLPDEDGEQEEVTV